jgi:F-type H+-transporting ATPase subunit b
MLLTPSFGLLFWMVVSFAFVFGLLAKFGFPIITQSVNERRNYIEQSLAKADEANRALENIRQKSEELLDEARKSQQEMIRDASLEANKIIRRAKEEAAVQGKQKLDEVMRSIDLQKQRAIGEIRSQVAVLSVDIAEKILRRQLDHTESYDQLISEFLDEIEHSATAKN